MILGPTPKMSRVSNCHRFRAKLLKRHNHLNQRHLILLKKSELRILLMLMIVTVQCIVGFGKFVRFYHSKNMFEK